MYVFLPILPYNYWILSRNVCFPSPFQPKNFTQSIKAWKDNRQFELSLVVQWGLSSSLNWSKLFWWGELEGTDETAVTSLLVFGIQFQHQLSFARFPSFKAFLYATLILLEPNFTIHIWIFISNLYGFDRYALPKQHYR